MIRFINCIRKRPEISHQEFRDYWSSQQFRQRMDRLVELLRPLSYARNLTLQTVGNDRINAILGNIEEPFDAIIEYWWDSAAEFYGRLDTPEVIALFGKILTEDAVYFDSRYSNGFFTEGHRSEFDY
ncbi:MAG: EthD domain-containing protein [Desulfuromusa sp.]|nr:EthD domain-containing protein [Desulfuromusa sp.]